MHIVDTVIFKNEVVNLVTEEDLNQLLTQSSCVPVGEIPFGATAYWSEGYYMVYRSLECGRLFGTWVRSTY